MSFSEAKDDFIHNISTPFSPITVTAEFTITSDENNTNSNSNVNSNMNDIHQTTLAYWDDANLLIEHSKQLWESKNVDEAKICIERCLQLQPQQMIFHMFAIQFYVDFGFLDLSYERCNDAMLLCEGIEGRQQWVITLLWIKAQILFTKKKFAEIVNLMNHALTIKHSHRDITYNWRGSAHCELKTFENAIEDYSNAIKESHRPASYYNSRGTCHQELKKLIMPWTIIIQLYV